MSILRTSFFLSVFLVVLCRADEEEFVPWRTLTLECGAIEKAGNVTLTVSTDGTVFKSFEIVAFGQTHKLSGAVLEQLRGFPLDSLKVTHSPGYRQTGGHGVYCKFRKTFYDPNKGTRQEEVVVMVNENQKVSILGPREIRR